MENTISETERKMFQVGEKIVYRGDVAQIVELREKADHTVSYLLKVLKDTSLKIEVPVTHTEFIRPLISRDEVETLIARMPGITSIDVADRLLEQEYRRRVRSGNHEDLIQIIKTTYLRNQNRIEHQLRVGERDLRYFAKAEESLYREFSAVLGLSFEETKQYVIDAIDRAKGSI